jgi:hypothetical protein
VGSIPIARSTFLWAGSYCSGPKLRTTSDAMKSAAGRGARRSLASSRPDWPVRLVSVTTVASAGILAIVGFHVLTH